MAAPGATIASDTFLALFGTPTLLWRVLNSVGYAKLPRYFWSEVVTEGQRWYDVRVIVTACVDNPQCQSPTPIDVGGCEDHDGGVGFVRKFTVGELAPVKSSPTSVCLSRGPIDYWLPRVSGSSIRFCFILFHNFVLTLKNDI